MKKSISLLLSIAVIFSLAACSSVTPSASDNDSIESSSVSYTEAVNDYFTIPASRDEAIEIPVGVTVPSLEEGEYCPVAILVHGFLGSKDEEFGFYANATDETYPYESMADQLLSLGIGTIRIDQPGSGESKDDFRNYTLENSVSDLQDAFDYCMDTYPFDESKVGLVGWSMGGKVGPKFISQNDCVSTLVLLNPAGDNGNNALLTAAAANLDWENLSAIAQENSEVLNEGASSFVGHDLYMSKAFFDQVNASVTGDEITAFIEAGGNGLMIYGDKDNVINPTTYQWLVDNSGIEYVCIPGMDHDLGLESNRPDYTRIVLDMTTSYLYRHLASSESSNLTHQ